MDDCLKFNNFSSPHDYHMASMMIRLSENIDTVQMFSHLLLFVRAVSSKKTKLGF